MLLFILYSVLMLLLLFARPKYSVITDYWELAKSNLNLVPFQTIKSFANTVVGAKDAYWVLFSAANLAGNVLMFIPLGVFLPKLFKRCRTFLRTFITGAVIILSIEICQLFSLRGVCDIDDFILNMVGISLGYGLFHLLLSYSSRK